MKLVPVETHAPNAIAAASGIGAAITISNEEGLAMARAVVRLFALWGLSDAQSCTLLGGASETTWRRWKKGDISRLSVDLKTRLSILMGIHKALRIIFTENERAYRWVRRDNTHFDNQPPLDWMLRGDLFALLDVRHYLDAMRG